MDDTRSPIRLTGEIRNSVLTAFHLKPGDLLRVEEVGERGEISVMPFAEYTELAALRRKLADIHEKHAMEFQRADKYRAELAARTEELRLARNYMGGLLGYIENDLERVDSALELLGVSDPAALLDEAQAFVCAP